MGKARSSWLGAIPSLDETVHAASTRKNQLQDAFKWHVKPARGNLCVQCERHTETAVRMFTELWRFPASGLPRFDPCAEHKPLPQQRVPEQRNPGAHGGTGRLPDRTYICNCEAICSRSRGDCRPQVGPRAGSRFEVGGWWERLGAWLRRQTKIQEVPRNASFALNHFSFS